MIFLYEILKIFPVWDSKIVNPIYEILILATEILNTEITVGEVDVLDYIYIYPNLIVKRLVQDEGSAVYIIEDKNSETKYQFAVRNLYFPPGYTA